MNLSERVEKLEKAVEDIHEDITDVWSDMRDDMTKGFEDIQNSINTKFDGIQTDLGVMKGAHAEAVTTRNPSLIADGLGYQFVSVIAREVLLGYGNLARDRGESSGDVESFKKADLVMLALDQGDPRYLAVEASYTVHRRDVDRVVRNASYLQEYTGIQSVGVVSGKEMMEDVEDYAAENNVRLYHLTDKDLQPD